MDAFVFNEPGFEHFVTDTSGQLAAILFTIGETIAIAAQETLGVQFPGGPNPAPGPPYRRTGDLQNSIRATHPHVTGLGMQVDVIANSAHRGFAYPQWLLYQGYQFVAPNYLSSLA